MSGRQNQSRKLSEFKTPEPDLLRAQSAAIGFIGDILTDPFGAGGLLTLCGVSGTGKTMLANIVLTELRLNPWGCCERIEPRIHRGKVERFTARLFDMRKVSDGFKQGNYGVVDRMEELDLCVLDDVGADHDPSKVTASKVDRVLRSRKNRWTIVTCNLSLKEIGEKLDARIASFMIRDDNRFVEIKAMDYAKRRHL